VRATGRRCHSLLLVTSAFACAAVLSACYGAGTTGGSYGRDWRFSNAGLVVEFAPAVDRITWFGPLNGPNMLFVTGEHRDVDPNRPIPGADAAASSSTCTFFGGCLTWVAPQAGPHGWTDGAGAPAPWPPDPAMDTGPCYRSGWSPTGFAATGPVHRSGLKETKEFVLLDRNSAELRFTLHNTTGRPISAATWISCAAHAADTIAVRLQRHSQEPGKSADAMIRGWAEDARSEELFRSVMSEPSSNGWALIRLADVNWDPGVKVFFDLAGEGGEIAVWHAGYWLHRRTLAQDEAGYARLVAAGEGRAAIFAEPRSHIVELQLTGPLVDIPPRGSTQTVERWTLIRSSYPDLSVLP